VEIAANQEFAFRATTGADVGNRLRVNAWVNRLQPYCLSLFTRETEFRAVSALRAATSRAASATADRSPSAGRYDNFQRDVWRPARRRAGLTDVTMYDLRHSFISLMQEEGVPVADLASATGHERVSTLQDIYTHAVGRSYDRMRAALAGSAPN
jgi:hypothetical protein